MLNASVNGLALSLLPRGLAMNGSNRKPGPDPRGLVQGPCVQMTSDGQLTLQLNSLGATNPGE